MPPGFMQVVTWSPDGGRLRSASTDGDLWVWDATFGASLVCSKARFDHVETLVWSPDGERLAAAGFEGLVQVWDAASGAPLGTFALGHDGECITVTSVAPGAEGRSLRHGQQ